MKRLAMLAALVALASSCSNSEPSDTCGPDLDAGGLFATFQVGSDVFNAQITDPPGIAEALSVATGAASPALIPTGTLDCTSSPTNCGWQWHLVPSTVTFIDFSDPACDATPSQLDVICPSFAPTYCPSAASLILLLDCRSGPCAEVN